MSYLPDHGTKTTRAGGIGGYLFPKPRVIGKNFNPMNPAEAYLYESNVKLGRNTIGDSLKFLCKAVGEETCTNHQVRVTSIRALRRAGLSFAQIAKISGNVHFVIYFKLLIAMYLSKFSQNRHEKF